MCFISNVSLMNIAPTSEFCVFKSMWRSWRRSWHCSYLYCAICMVHVSNGVEPVVWRQIISHWSNYSDVTWASWRLKSTGARRVEQQINIVSEIHQGAVGFPHKGPVMEKIPVFLHEEPLWWKHIFNSNVDVMTWIRFPPHPLSVESAGHRWLPTQLISDVLPSTVVELTAMWYYVMLMWCHYNDKWAVNFNVLTFFETIAYKNWESLNCPVSLWFEICALESWDVLMSPVDHQGGALMFHQLNKLSIKHSRWQ